MRVQSIIDVDNCESAVKWRITRCCNYKCSYCIQQKASYGDSFTKDYEMALKIAPEISRIIDELPGKSVKLDIIGGEVLYLDLIPIFENMGTFKIKQVNITTNLSASSSSIISLGQYLMRRNITLSITASYHSEFMDIQTYFNKLEEILKHEKLDILIKGEMVSHRGNQEKVKEYIQEAESRGISYTIDKDLRKNNSFSDEELISKTSDSKNCRYKVYTDTGEEDIKSKNIFLSKYGTILGGRPYFISTGYYCTHDYTYVYIDKNMHVGKLNENDDCCARHYVGLFHPLKYPTICKKRLCILCGHFSLSKSADELIQE